MNNPLQIKRFLVVLSYPPSTKMVLPYEEQGEKTIVEEGLFKEKGVRVLKDLREYVKEAQLAASKFEKKIMSGFEQIDISF
ncbi:hypothetical protein C4A76_20845 [Brevibacillus laterosporus]|nr:hypothetical protein C4A76_20845 [Brevibacillus laterosporus]